MKESAPMTTSTPQAPMVFLDEFGYHFGGRNDTLKEDLRKIDGVPNATYLFKDGQVFVFDKFRACSLSSTRLASIWFHRANLMVMGGCRFGC